MRRLVLGFIAALLLPFAAQAQTNGSAVGGAAANQSGLMGGLCQSAPIGLTNGQQAGLLIDCTTHALITAGPGGTGTVVTGGQSNAGAGVTTSQNLGSNSYNYVWGGTGWTQLLGDNFSATTSHMEVVGSSPAAATDDGTNPEKMGCVYQATPTTYTDGQRANLGCNAAGQLRISANAYTTADGVSPSAMIALANQLGTSAPLATAGYVQGLSTWGRQRDLTGAGLTGLGTTAVGIAPATVSTAAPGTSVTGQTVTAIVAKAAPGNLYGFNVVSGTTAGFVVVNNTTAAPTAAAATTPLYCIALAASSSTNWRSDVPLKGTVGLVLLFSTSCGTYTPVSPAAVFMQSEAP